MDAASLLSPFPPVAFAFAYGSGVVPQASYGGAPPPMVDLVLAVDDPPAWHAANLSANRAHYSAVGALGAGALAALQEAGAGLYYNTHVPLPPSAGGAPKQLMKYGVIGVRALLDDLLTWRSLYAAGRLHKPVRMLACERPAVLAAARANLRHALTAALLQLPAAFTAAQLYTRVAALSYLGDFRMLVGENPDKVANIVAGGLPRFHALYAPLLRAHFPGVAPASAAAAGRGRGGGDDEAATAAYTQDTSVAARLALGTSLPLRVQRGMAALASADAEGGGGGGAAWGPSRLPRQAATAGAASAWSSPAASLATGGWTALHHMQARRAEARWWGRAHVPAAAAAAADARGLLRAPAATMALRLPAWGDRGGAGWLPGGTPPPIALPPGGAAPWEPAARAAAGDPRVAAFWDAMAARGGDVAVPVAAYLRPAVARIVAAHAGVQALKGIVTAGPGHAALYGLQKLGKMVGGGLRRLRR